MRKSLRRALILASVPFAVGGAVAGIGISGAVESWLFYFPSRRAFADAPGAQPVTFTTADGLNLSGWFFPAKAPAADAPPDSPTDPATRAAINAASQLATGESPTPATAPADATTPPRLPTILVAHGNAGCLPDHDEFCAFLADHGFNVLLFDYRGYGRSDLPTRGLNRTDLVADARAAFDYLLTRPDVDPDRIGLLGYSLGGNIGLGFVAIEPRVRAVVTLATFSRWKEVASDHAGSLGRFLIPEGLDAVDSVARLEARPYLIVHGDDDDIVPFRHAALLEAAARDAGVHVTRLNVVGGDHLDLTKGTDIQAAIARFFAESMPPVDASEAP